MPYYKADAAKSIGLKRTSAVTRRYIDTNKLYIYIYILIDKASIIHPSFFIIHSSLFILHVCLDITLILAFPFICNVDKVEFRI